MGYESAMSMPSFATVHPMSLSVAISHGLFDRRIIKLLLGNLH